MTVVEPGIMADYADKDVKEAPGEAGQLAERIAVPGGPQRVPAPTGSQSTYSTTHAPGWF